MSAPDISLSCNREDQARAKAGNGPQLHRACHDATNGRVDRERPVASALLNRRDLAHKLPFAATPTVGRSRHSEDVSAEAARKLYDQGSPPIWKVLATS